MHLMCFPNRGEKKKKKSVLAKTYYFFSTCITFILYPVATEILAQDSPMS